MCTAMSIISKNKNVIFGRTLDFSHELDPELYIMPRNYEWKNDFNDKIVNQYKYIGIGQDIGKIVFTDGVNEKGLSCASLYFQGYAQYDSLSDNNKHLSIGSVDLISYLLGNCSNINEVINVVNNINIVGVEDPVTNTIAPLHWIVADKAGRCIVIEKTMGGLEIYNNKIKVLANSPGFDWHITNLRNYLNILPTQSSSAKFGDVELIPFGQGAGTWGLPGDYTSPSRFIRVAYQKSFTIIPDTLNEAINTCFNIMKTVSIPKGVVITNKGTSDYTQYTSFINLNTGDYYFNSYNNNKILTANINQVESHEIISLGKIKRTNEFETI